MIEITHLYSRREKQALEKIPENLTSYKSYSIYIGIFSKDNASKALQGRR